MKTEKTLAGVQVAEIMTRNVQTVMINDSIKDTVSLMLDHSLTMVPVIDTSNKCIGVLSRSDLTEFFLEEDLELSAADYQRFSMEAIHRSLETSDARQVKEMMTYDVSQIDEETSITDACREMVKKRVHHLPVVNKEGQVTGILSSFDVVAAVAEL